MEIISFLRSFRSGPFAIFDFAISYLFVYLISPYLFKIGLKLSREQLLWLTLPVSILVHIIFGIDTPLTIMFLDPYGGYLVKISILFMIAMAFFRRKRPKI